MKYQLSTRFHNYDNVSWRRRDTEGTDHGRCGDRPHISAVKRSVLVDALPYFGIRAFRIALWIVSVALLLSVPARVFAQQAGTFDQLQLLVKPGDTVSITDSAGKSFQARINAMSSSSLRLSVAGATRTLSEIEVSEIRQRRADSLANGARNGALIGGGIGLLGAIGWCVQGGRCAGVAAGSIFFYSLFGTGIGVGIDALIERPQTIYRPRGRPSSGAFTLTPVLQGGSRGVVLSVSF